MAATLVGAKSLYEPVLDYSQLNTSEQIAVKSESIFMQENELESIVCLMAAILSRPQYVKVPRLDLIRA